MTHLRTRFRLPGRSNEPGTPLQLFGHGRKGSRGEPADPGVERAEKWQERWSDVVGDLPAQISRKQICMISIGGAIGTGLFLGTGNALWHGGPVGLVLGYLVMGSVVYCTVISFGEMVAFQPAIGGPVGLANVYVDEALAFALGWNAWFNWTIVLPAEISAAVMLMSFYPTGVGSAVWTVIFLLLAVLINSIGTQLYAVTETRMTFIKVSTIVLLIILGLAIDFGASKTLGPIGFTFWKNPGPFNTTLYGNGPLGGFMCFVNVLFQAAFSFFGTEVPAVAAGEVINARKNIPAAINLTWIRITLFYVVGVFVMSLLVPWNDPGLVPEGGGGTNNSPFIIALNSAFPSGFVSYLFNALFLLSAWSAASSDVYVSSRYMFNLARLGHAPKWLGSLWHPPGVGSNKRAVPWVGILVAAIFGTLAFMPDGDTAAATIFSWLSATTSAAALQAWVGILFTYLRWYQGTILAVKNGVKNIEDFHRSPLQPYAAYYAFVMCVLILIFNGSTVFFGMTWRLAVGENDVWPPPSNDPAVPLPVTTFLTAYIPLPLFILLLFGYKLIRQTEMVPVHEMPSSLNWSGFDSVDEEEVEADYANLPRWKRYVLPVLDFFT